MNCTQVIPTTHVKDFVIAGGASHTSRDIRSGNPHQRTQAKLPYVNTSKTAATTWEGDRPHKHTHRAVRGVKPHTNARPKL